MTAFLSPRSRAHLDEVHATEHRRIEEAADSVVLFCKDYPAGYQVPQHSHHRIQFLCAVAGVILVETLHGRFITPPGYAVLIPPGLFHAVSMLSDVRTNSVYISPRVRTLIRDRPIVVGLTDLARSLLIEAATLSESGLRSRKLDLVRSLLIEEIVALREKPLALSFPADRRLSMLCRDFLANPSPYARIDDWAEQLGMSRRTFTRFFRRETGVSFVAWKQQASVFSSLPRLAEGKLITAVALDAGYESATAFTTMFHRVLGMTPRNYVRDSRFFAGRGPEAAAEDALLQDVQRIRDGPDGL